MFADRAQAPAIPTGVFVELLRVQFHQDSPDAARQPGDGGWRHDAAVGRGRSCQVVRRIGVQKSRVDRTETRLNMPTIECHGCLRKVDTREIRWIKPFGGRVWRTDDGVLVIEPVELYHPEDGACPYCATCREIPDDSK